MFVTSKHVLEIKKKCRNLLKDNQLSIPLQYLKDSTKCNNFVYVIISQTVQSFAKPAAKSRINSLVRSKTKTSKIKTRRLQK